MGGFGEFAYSARFRDWVIGLVRNEIDRRRPLPFVATVASFDRGLHEAVVTTGSGDNIVVRMGAIQPADVGQQVRIGGVPGDNYIIDVFGEAFLATS